MHFCVDWGLENYKFDLQSRYGWVPIVSVISSMDSGTTWHEGDLATWFIIEMVFACFDCVWVAWVGNGVCQYYVIDAAYGDEGWWEGWRSIAMVWIEE